MRIVFLDNRDSFTFNLVHYLEELGATVSVFNHDEKTSFFNPDNFDGLVIGPGPNTPRESGSLMKIIDIWVRSEKSILGICLGHQGIGEYFGLNLIKSKKPMHGKATKLTFSGKSILYKNINNPVSVGRYHSLIVSGSCNELEVTAVDEDQQIMSLTHKILPIHSVQFHPESVNTPQGKLILKNWLQSIQALD